MKQQVLSFFPHTGLIAFGLFLFFASFTAVVWRTYFKNKKEFYDEISQLPLGRHHQ